MFKAEVFHLILFIRAAFLISIVIATITWMVVVLIYNYRPLRLTTTLYEWVVLIFGGPIMIGMSYLFQDELVGTAQKQYSTAFADSKDIEVRLTTWRLRDEKMQLEPVVMTQRETLMRF